MKTAIRTNLTKADNVRIGYRAAFLLLLISLLLTTFSVKQFMSEVKLVDETNTVLAHLGAVTNGLKEAQAGVSGFFIMKDKAFLSPFVKSRPLVDTAFKNLAGHKGSVPLEKGQLNLLRKKTEELFNKLDVLLRNESAAAGTSAERVRETLRNEQSTMLELNAMIGKMQRQFINVLNDRTKKMHSTSSAIQTINIVSLVVSFMLAFYSFITFNRENRSREQADKKADDYRNTLEETVSELRKLNGEMVLLKTNEKFASTGRIARTIAHEVRNPLTNINLAIDQLKEELVAQQEDAGLLLEMVSRNSARINQLVTELLNATRFSELNFEKKGINELLEESLALAADVIQLKHIRVETIVQADNCFVDVDADKMKIAFLNIIENAVEAMEDTKGVLILKTVVETPYCVIYITDNGHGLDEEAMQRLFEPYFSSKVKGSGLGMTNTQNIILNHKGIIRAENNPGEGTTVIVSLLLASLPQQAGIEG